MQDDNGNVVGNTIPLTKLNQIILDNFGKCEHSVFDDIFDKNDDFVIEYGHYFREVKTHA